MNIEQIYTGCLAQGTYYITDQKEAIIIDPLRDIQSYLNRIQRDGIVLKYIFETHFHADFVSGHLELAAATGAKIIYGPTAQTDFDCMIAEDNQVFLFGESKLKILHTPGHTMESISLLLIDKTDKNKALFTGDTLFLGDVGRPDLSQKSGLLTKEDLAGYLYDSLQNKIMPLEDDILVYPAHGAGSACGKNMMDVTVDTLGNQKKVNYALNQSNKQTFVKAVLEGLLDPPNYFASTVQLNKNGKDRLELKIDDYQLNVINIDTYLKQKNVVILDTRNPEIFCRGFIPQSLNIGMNKNLAPWVGTILKDVRKPIILVTPEGLEEEAITRLRRVGFDRILGYLKGGFEQWKNEGRNIEVIHRISANSFLSNNLKEAAKIIDIRKGSEFEKGHLKDAINLPLEEIDEWKNTITKQQHYYIHCRSGYRSMIASSILKQCNFTKFTEIEGGILAIEEAGANII